MESSPVLLDAALILPTPTRLGVLIHSESETEGIQGEKSFHGTEIQLSLCGFLLNLMPALTGL